MTSFKTIKLQIAADQLRNNYDYINKLDAISYLKTRYTTFKLSDFIKVYEIYLEN